MSRRLSALIILAFALCIFSGCTLFSTRPKNFARTVFRIIPTADGICTDDFYRKMDSLTGSSLTRGNKVSLLNNGNSVFPAMIREIEGAKDRISIESYILRLDDTGKLFVDALARAAKRGVEVRFLIDSVGSRSVKRGDFDDMVEAGVELRFFNPLESWTVMRFNNRDHRKILVVDGRAAFLGGLNLAEEYNGDGLRPKTHWRDTALRVEGPAATEAEKIFALSWRQGGSDFLGKDLPIVGVSYIKHAVDDPLMKLLGRETFGDFPEPREGSGGAGVRVVYSAPDRIASRILDMYILAISSAKKNVYITNAYYVPPLNLSRAICDAARRGVDVRMILQGETDEPTARMISVGYYGKLIKAGVKVYEWQPSLLHAKTMVVDGKWCTVGSANLDGRALFLNYESNLAVSDPELARQMEASFAEDLKHCKPVDYDDWKSRPFKQKAREWMLYPFEGQF